MNILLISQNPTIKKLFMLSAEKKGDDVEIGEPDFLPEDSFDVIFLDKDLYSEEFFGELQSKYDSKFILILIWMIILIWI